MSAPVTFANDPDAAFAQYLEDGFFVEPDVVPPDLCDRLIAAGERLPAALDNSYVPVMQVHKMDSIYLSVMGEHRILSIMDQLVNGKCAGLQTQFFFTPPQRAGLGFHQDNYFVEAPADGFASAWVPLVDVTPSNGGLYAFRGSHKFGKLPVKKIDATGLDKRQTVYEETVMSEDFEKVDIFVKRGSAVLIHGFVVHGSYQNNSSEKRYVLLNTYIRDGAPFRPGLTAKREQFQFDRAA